MVRALLFAACLITIAQTHRAFAVDIDLGLFDLPTRSAPEPAVITRETVTVRVFPPLFDETGVVVRENGQIVSGSIPILVVDLPPNSTGRHMIQIRVPTGQTRQMVNIEFN